MYILASLILMCPIGCTSERSVSTENSKFFPNISTNETVKVEITCFEFRQLCAKLKQKNADVTVEPFQDTYIVKLDGRIFKKLSTMKLCGLKSTTPDMVFRVFSSSHEDLSFSIVFNRTDTELFRKSILSGIPVDAHSVMDSYPCEKSDAIVFANSLNEIFF